MSKRFLVILMVCVLGLIGVYVATADKDEATPSNNNAVTTSNHVFGNNKKKVTLLEYGDFECPACASYFPIVQQIKDKYQDDIQFQFRHFPLSNNHPNARAASRAAEAAGKQGKFWEMHDLLYQQQQTWSSGNNATQIFESFAGQINLDITKYKQDFASSEVNDIINADFAEGTKQGVSSTPTFFLQGQKINDSPTSIEEFSKLIDEAIKKSGQ